MSSDSAARSTSSSSGRAALDRRGHVEEDELFRSDLGVAARELDWVAHVAQALEADARDDAAAHTRRARIRR